MASKYKVGDEVHVLTKNGEIMWYGISVPPPTPDQSNGNEKVVIDVVDKDVPEEKITGLKYHFKGRIWTSGLYIVGLVGKDCDNCIVQNTAIMARLIGYNSCRIKE